ncbi:MAG: NmrA/HSCARG family protein [Bdellovibrionota bacterium]
MPKSRLVMVSGATGNQGGAVSRQLLQHGHRVRVLTRRPDSAEALEFKRLGAEIFQGDFEDRDSLERAMRGVNTVFAVGTPAERGVEWEVRHGQNMADAAKAEGVLHYVYSSVVCANRDTGIPHFDSKAKVENHIRNIGIPFTIISPVYFMENLFSPSVWSDLLQGRLSMPLPGGTVLQQICLEDIANFVLLVIENRDQFVSRRFDIAGDELNGFRAAEILSEIAGRNFAYNEIPLDVVRDGNPAMATMFDWLNHVGTDVNIELLRRQFPEVGWHSFESWARGRDWSILVQQAA